MRGSLTVFEHADDKENFKIFVFYSLFFILYSLQIDFSSVNT